MFSTAPPWIIGHRGAAGLVPENTLPSFERAFAAGVAGIELDVYCVNEQLLVIHDDTLERTTNGQGKVQQAQVSYLRSLDAGLGAQIPLLQEVLDITPPGVVVNIELKGRNTGAAVAAACAAHGHTGLLVSSFRAAELRQFRRLDPHTAVAPLLHRWPPAPWRGAAQVDAWAVNLSAKIVTPKRLRAIHKRGYRCLVYTVNGPDQARELLRMGVDGLFTDRPDLLAGITI